MLIGKYSGGDEHCGLLAVDRGLECGAYCHLGLSESNIAAYETVHGFRALHIGFHGFGCSQLVRGVFVDE